MTERSLNNGSGMREHLEPLANKQAMNPRIRGFSAKTKNLLLIGSIFLNLYLLLPWYEINSSLPVRNTNIVNTDHHNITHKTHPARKLPRGHKLHHRVIHKKKPTFAHNASNVFCQAKSPWAEKAIQHPTTTELKNWAFKTRRKCPDFKIIDTPPKRQQIVLHCETNNSYMFTMEQKQSDKITSIKFGDQCLIDVIDSCCYDDNKVPNVAHFIWFGDSDNEMGYFQYLTFMSLLRFMQPCLILIHGPSTPYGKYWDSFISQTPNIIHVRRKRPISVYGHPLAFKEHASDLMRIEALQKYGGVYVDFDEVLLRSLDPLRKYDYVQGHELNYTLGSQLVLAKKNATFLTHWHHSYRDNYKKGWSFNALWVPWIIARRHPRLIHVEGYNFTRPSWKNVHLIFDENYNWSTNYGMHLFIRWYKKKINTDIIRTLNTTIGSVSRHILLGNKELCIR